MPLPPTPGCYPNMCTHICWMCYSWWCCGIHNPTHIRVSPLPIRAKCLSLDACMMTSSILHHMHNHSSYLDPQENALQCLYDKMCCSELITTHSDNDVECVLLESLQPEGPICISTILRKPTLILAAFQVERYWIRPAQCRYENHIILDQVSFQAYFFKMFGFPSKKDLKTRIPDFQGFT